jgi:hypothetical protein
MDTDVLDEHDTSISRVKVTSSTNIEACPSEMSAFAYRTTRCHNTENNLRIRWSENHNLYILNGESDTTTNEMIMVWTRLCGSNRDVRTLQASCSETSSKCNLQWLPVLLGRTHTKETGNRNATAISEICYQPELNTCYWMEQHKLRKLQRKAWKDWETHLPGNGVCQSSDNCVDAWFPGMYNALQRFICFLRWHERLTKFLILFLCS